ncbi:SGNH/GDSL hydrolase family protein [Spirulina major CS-329]|uniref:SGNH/GDSL hydrolase family protein n=1 Tax=Spirulina TaxID=1154 RepID=UPI00232B8A4C|nr:MULTISPECIES: SGNH/GDSL hydrolase family protein [Spirulina]MDB9496953.1 SGNH/GDSL hydrolase family protein [Spirulina subsalsa CS-330]MDB9502589.1 SGNH/GDSL hydrolase family protein [Spirulina major CS-329]
MYKKASKRISRRVFCLTSFFFLGLNIGRLAKSEHFPWLQLKKKFPADHPFIRYIGRVDQRDPQAVRLGWSGSTITFRFSGAYCAVMLNAPPNDKGLHNYFAVIIDEQAPFKIAIYPGLSQYTIATDLEPGEHHVTLYKRTEVERFSPVTFRGIELALGETLLPLPPPLDRTIELIGDSHACGFGNEANHHNDPFEDHTENAYLAYGAIAARLLNANLINLCRSGFGLTRNANGETTPTMPHHYELLLPPEPEPWNFQSYIPDCVLIHLGTNDGFYKVDRTPDRALFVETGVALVNRIQARYPSAQLVWLFLDRTLPNGDPSVAEDYLREIQRTIDAQGGKSIEIFEIAGAREEWGYGAVWHPSLTQHQYNGEKLASFLGDLLGWS